MSEDYYKTLIKDIIENNDKEEVIKIIANKLNEKQLSNEKEILTNIEKDKEIERLNNIIKEAINYIDDNTYYKSHKGHINIDGLYIILQKGSDKE